MIKNFLNRLSKEIGLRLHRLAITRGLYTVVYSGEMEIGKTWFGTHFLVGDYAPQSLEHCIRSLTGYVWELSYEGYERD
jgi:hypothetical protein